MPADRTVHARTAVGDEIVRYDRAGKWFIEYAGSRRQITLAEAVGIATWPGATVFTGLPGGGAFDRKVAGRV
jgi:hypothetical protein